MPHQLTGVSVEHADGGDRGRRTRGAISGRDPTTVVATVVHTLRAIGTRVIAWKARHARASGPDTVVIGTLTRPKLAITIRAMVVRTETTPPPIPRFLERIIAQPLSPYCPRCSLPLERWQADHGAEGPPRGYECRPCGTQLRWTPDDVLKQMQREVRRHYPHYWAQYRAAIRQHAPGTPRP
jgi:hypothetical protein